MFIKLAAQCARLAGALLLVAIISGYSYGAEWENLSDCEGGSSSATSDPWEASCYLYGENLVNPMIVMDAVAEGGSNIGLTFGS
jgi:hypothetical protein